MVTVGVAVSVAVITGPRGGPARRERATIATLRERATSASAASPFRFFGPTSFWNEQLSPSAALDPDSSAIVSAFYSEVAAGIAAGRGLFINTTKWSVPIYTVSANQPTVKVALEDAWRSPSLQERSPALQQAWDAVPLPANAKPAAGTDMHLVVWQPSSNKLWEFWRLESTKKGWQAASGGAIQNVTSAWGANDSEAWPGDRPGWGATASELSVAGGVITLEDLQRGVINHALAIGIPGARANVYASPARRTDGRSRSPLALPEGAHLRLDPNLDLAALHLPPLTRMMAQAAQRYGIFVRDTSATITFYAQDPTPTGAGAYTGRGGYFEGRTPRQLVEAFPWSHLQLLKMQLHAMPWEPGTIDRRALSIETRKSVKP